MVHIILPAPLRRIGHMLRRRPLGADEQHASAASHGVTHGPQRPVQHRDGLLQVDDMDLIAHPEQERRHARVPAAGVVAEMHAGFEQLAHGEIGHRHRRVLSFWLCLRGALVRLRTPEPPRVRITGKGRREGYGQLGARAQA